MKIIKTRAERYSAIFLSWGFLLSLFILILNDFLLKGIFGNWITGKLSDFAGLFIFPLALTAIFPRYIKVIHILTAVSFCLFKSPLANPVISAWNSLGILNIGRVIDYTDLIALPMIAVSCVYAGSILSKKMPERKGFSRNLATNFVLFLSLFTFGATNRVDKTTPVKINTVFNYCAQDIYKVLPRLISNKKEPGIASLDSLNKESGLFEIYVSSKNWKNIWFDDYQDTLARLGLILEQRCDSRQCTTTPRFVCSTSGKIFKDKISCDGVHHKGAARAQVEIDRFWERLKTEMSRSGARKNPSSCPPAIAIK
ncbi:hypothetical protein KKF34_13760 [Myxococcota bacterium]|nr:hypothetical protein [Myxococcota bacterium]MBU1382501.1 hypothetical protein [Myxococcota bacterium]MBU1497937.1 hypothetical protein [Myxococcota bacterium]